METSCAHPSVNSMRVLHIEDDPDYVAITKMYLESLDPEMEVVSSLSSIESLPLIESMQFDCVVCDYMMPEMDGIELCRRLRRTSDVPFIIHTGQGNEGVASIAFDAGVDDYIRKEPGRSQYRVLANRIRQAVEKYRVERLYRNVLENSKDGIIIVQGTRIVYANQAMADLMGVSSLGELLGTDVLDWVVEEDQSRLKSIALGRQRGDSPPSHFEVTFRRPDGEHRVVNISSSLINYKGRSASLGIVRDVSEKVRQRERLATLHSCTIELASAESIEEIAKQTLDSIEEVFDFRWGDFSILEAGRVIPVHFKGVTYEAFDILDLNDPGVIARAARTGESQLVPDTRMDEDYLPTLIDGNITTLSELAVPIKSNGNVIGVINLESPELDGFSVDDQKLLEIYSQYVASAVVRLMNEGLLRASEEKYRNILESSLDAVTVSSDNKIVYSNKRSLEILGYDEFSEVKRMRLLDLVHPEDKETARKVYERRSKGERGVINYTVRVRRKDGQYIHLESRTNGIEFEGRAAIISIARDITDRKRLEEELRTHSERLEKLISERTSELRESEERFRNVIDNLPMGLQMYKIDANGDLRFLAANPTADNIGSKPSSAYIGKTLDEGFPNVDKAIKKRFKEIAEKGGYWHEEAIRYEEDQISNATDNYAFQTAPGEMASVFRDITEQKRMEEDLLSAERLATAGRVAAMMGHDLRGPLVVIGNAVNLARGNPEKTDRMLDMIDRNAGQAMDILEELRTRTKDEPVTLTPIEIRKFLGKATEDLFLPDEVKLHVEIDEGLSDIVLDEAKTLRALDNLIRNAIDVMPDGGTLKLEATRETDQIVIRVSDTGTGVTDEARRNLFKPFYTTKPGGMGLGLASTRRMVAVQGGTISFQTKAGEGSTFAITLPLKKNPDQ